MAKPGLGGSGYRRLRDYMKEHLPWICHRCNKEISREITARNPRHRNAWSADHWPIPRSHGGRSVLENMQPAHNGCNSLAGNVLKGSKNPSSRDWKV